MEFLEESSFVPWNLWRESKRCSNCEELPTILTCERSPEAREVLDAGVRVAPVHLAARRLVRLHDVDGVAAEVECLAAREVDGAGTRRRNLLVRREDVDQAIARAIRAAICS